MTSVTIGGAKMPVKTFLILVLSASICVASASNQLHIRVNQLGFAPSDVKTAVVFGRESQPEEFRVVNATTGAEVFRGKVNPVTGSWGQFDRHGELDFSALRVEGLYVVEAGSARSQKFTINQTVNTQLPDQLLDFMRQQRCGYNPFVDAACHTFDGRTAFGPAPAGTYLNASGGWHDAGDQLKYLLTSSNATAQMLLAYQLGPRAKFADRFNNLGQPGANGIPDILDEAIWEDVHLFANALMKKMIRGGLIDGPVYQKVFKSLRGVFIREPDPFAPFQDERAVYHDDINDYSTNEPTMDGTASAILLYALH